MRAIRRHTTVAAMALVVMSTLYAHAQFGDVFNKVKRGSDKAKKVQEATAGWTPEQEKAIGEAAAAKLIHIFGLYKGGKSDAMHQYVNLVGYTVAQQAPNVATTEYKFGILDTEALTAFGLPGGYVFITRGALANMKDESELAGTLAHEIAHVDSHHLEKELRAKKMSKLGSSEVMDQVGNRVPYGGLLKELASQVVTQAITQGYSRDKEDEADRKGTEMAAAAGYKADGLRNFLATIQQAKTDKDDDRRLGVWGGTHPPLEQRVAALTAQAAKFSGGEDLADRFDDNAAFGKTKKELAAEKAAEEQAAKEAAEKAAAEKAGGQKGKAAPPKAKTKRRPQ